jgi:hypothetical protein
VSCEDFCEYAAVIVGFEVLIGLFLSVVLPSLYVVSLFAYRKGGGEFGSLTGNVMAREWDVKNGDVRASIRWQRMKVCVNDRRDEGVKVRGGVP